MAFELVSDYQPEGDQGQAIEKLVKSLEAGNRHQTLLGVTGSGKTFTMANLIARQNKPTLIMSHNKTLAAQLYSEFRNFFPNNAVEYFVSYFDYYQPEAYIPRSDTYIEKDSSINDEIERLRLSTMGSLLTRGRARWSSMSGNASIPIAVARLPPGSAASRRRRRMRRSLRAAVTASAATSAPNRTRPVTA